MKKDLSPVRFTERSGGQTVAKFRYWYRRRWRTASDHYGAGIYVDDVSGEEVAFGADPHCRLCRGRGMEEVSHPNMDFCGAVPCDCLDPIKRAEMKKPVTIEDLEWREL